MDIGRAKKTITRRKKIKRVGRGTGSGSGKLSGRGRDGAASRSGWHRQGRHRLPAHMAQAAEGGLQQHAVQVEDPGRQRLAVERLPRRGGGDPGGPAQGRHGQAGAGRRRQDPGPGRAGQGPDRQGERLQRLGARPRSRPPEARRKTCRVPLARHKTGYVAAQRAAEHKEIEAAHCAKNKSRKRKKAEEGLNEPDGATGQRVWRIRDLRRKLLITLGVMAACRLGGCTYPCPAWTPSPWACNLQRTAGSAGGQMLHLVDLFSGGALPGAPSSASA